MIDESAIREIVGRLARPTASGGHAIERAAILAEGSDCAAIETWIVSHGGEPQAGADAPRGRGLHAERSNARATPPGAAPTRYVLPATSLS
ncbi:MAG TPA: hypothetical protein VFF79_13300 [Conexibacter sp.]|jgi:hypothetical protein|nr:hypothetical protein [Conexibacter sp.]